MQTIGATPFDPTSHPVVVNNNGLGNIFGMLGQMFTPTAAGQERQLQAAQIARQAAAAQGLGHLFAGGAFDPAQAGAYLGNGGTPDELNSALRTMYAANGGANYDPRVGPLLDAAGHYAGSREAQLQSEAASADAAAKLAQVNSAARVQEAQLTPESGVDASGNPVPMNKAQTSGYLPLPSGASIAPTEAGVKGVLANRVLNEQPTAPAQDAAPAPPADYGPASSPALNGGGLGSMFASHLALAPTGAPDTGPGALAAAQPAQTLTDDQSKLLGVTPTAPKLEVKQTGADALGNPVYSVFNSATGELTSIKPGAQQPGGPAPSPADPMGGLHGEEFLKTLPPEVQNMVRQIAEGRSLPPPPTTRNGRPNPLMQAVAQYDPSFDGSQAQARYQARKDFEAGGPNSVASAITAGNTAIGHLGALSDLASQLGNGNVPVINGVKNAVGSAFGGKVPLAEYNAVVGRLAEELTKFYRGTGGTEQDVARDIATLNPNMSPQQLNGAIAAMGKLVQSKVDSLQARWHNAMGAQAPDFQIIQPHAQHALDVIMQRAGGKPGGDAAPPPIPQPGGQVQLWPPPKMGEIQSGYVYKGGDPAKPESWQALPGGGK